MAKIIVDSGCDTNCISIKNIDIDIIPLNLQIDNKNFIDDYNLDLKLYMNEMKKSKNIVKTSAPSSELYLDKFLSSDEDIFVVTLSSKLSCSYNSAHIAKETYLENPDNPKKFIHIFDSLTASSGETLIALKINELINKNYKNEEIVKEVDEFIKSINTFFILESYDNLVKNGRISSYLAKISSILSIKPICKNYDGIPKMFTKAHGANNAINKLIKHISSESIDFKNKLIAITHVNSLEKAIYIKNKLQEKVNFKDILILEASGLVCTYADDKGIVISY